MPLTIGILRNITPRQKTIRLFDGAGLYLEVAPRGGKWWRFKYRFDGKESRISLGVYPEVSLKEAREKCYQARKLLHAGVNPSENRRAAKASRADRLGNNFEVLAREWLAKHAPRWNELYRETVLRRLEKDVFPWIGRYPMTELKAPQILAMLRRIEERGAIEVAYRALQYCGQVFRYAVITGRAERNPCDDLRGALTAVKQGHFAAIIEPKAAGALLRAIDAYQGYIVTKHALRLAPLVFVRPGELRQAEWKEIDFDNAEWNIPSERMKMREPHLVPLSRQAMEILKEVHVLTGQGRYIFPSARTILRPMSNNTVVAALRRMGYTKDEMTGHGFRAMARTILDEVLGVRPDFIEHQLAHAVRDPNGRAYNRTSHIAERRKMMQQWADYLDELKTGAKVIPITLKAAETI